MVGVAVALWAETPDGVGPSVCFSGSAVRQSSLLSSSDEGSDDDAPSPLLPSPKTLHLLKGVTQALCAHWSSERGQIRSS